VRMETAVTESPTLLSQSDACFPRFFMSTESAR
jgi:hypothetical protein